MPAPKKHFPHCRVCAAALKGVPILVQQNMPAAAQCLPRQQDLAQDLPDTLNLYQCSDCGLIQLPGKPVAYYREVIRAAGFSAEMRDFRRQQFQQWIDDYRLADKHIVEIGCGRGEYLALLAECNVQACGIEYGRDSVRTARAAGLNVERAFMGRNSAQKPLNGAPFDGFMMLNFLEHMPHPRDTLRQIAANLKDGAIGLMEVPNVDMILQEKLFAEFIRDHLLYFTEDSLRTALSLGGFEVLAIKPVWHDYILSAVVRKRPTADTAPLLTQQQHITSSLQAYAARHDSLAVWGAGHQALAILALCDMGRHVRYVLDSAPFKQGRYTPASHRPIVAPEHLAAEPVSAVIIMAASYSDEVARVIQSRFPAVKNIAILREHGLEIVRENSEGHA